MNNIWWQHLTLSHEHILTEVMAKKAVPTEKPFWALTKQISVLFESTFSAQLSFIAFNT